MYLDPSNGNIYDNNNKLICQNMEHNTSIQDNKPLQIYQYYDGIYLNFFYHNSQWN